MPGILISVLKSLKNRALMLFVSFLMFCCVATAGGTEQLWRLESVAQSLFWQAEGDPASLFHSSLPLEKKTAAVKTSAPLEPLLGFERQDAEPHVSDHTQYPLSEGLAVLFILLFCGSLTTVFFCCFHEGHRQKIIFLRRMSGRYPPL